MRLFISHSSTDSWIARKVAEDLERLGITVFLDAKDLESGDVFDEAISEEIRRTDEMLVIISPAALKSMWVILEFGAAQVLRKRLIPILVNVSPNELPHPINRYIARDINQIEKYYSELVNRNESGRQLEVAIAVPPPPLDRTQSVVVGDRVRISESPREPGKFPVLSEDMKNYLGMLATVMERGWSEQEATTFRLDIDEGLYLWADRWLNREEPDDR